MQRLGHLGLGKKSYFELGRILRKERICFPMGGIKGTWDEKWSQGRASLSFPSQVKPTLLPMSYIFSQVIIYLEKTLVKKFHY